MSKRRRIRPRRLRKPPHSNSPVGSVRMMNLEDRIPVFITVRYRRNVTHETRRHHG